MSLTEFLGWIEYYEMEPFGEVREDLRMGILAAIIANTTRTKKSDKIYKPEDFIPKFERKEIQSPKQQLKIVEFLNTAFGGRDLRK